MGRQASAEHAGGQMALIATSLGVGVAIATLTYHIVRTRFLVVAAMDNYARNPALTVETYYRLIDHWRNGDSPIFEFTCPARHKTAIMDYCARFRLTCMLRVADSIVYRDQITFLVSKNTTLSHAQ